MILAIGGGSSMDTAKGIGIIVDNPEFEDVVSLEGGEPMPRSMRHSPLRFLPPLTLQPKLQSAMLLLIRIKFAYLFVLMLTIFQMLLLSIPI